MLHTVVVLAAAADGTMPATHCAPAATPPVYMAVLKPISPILFRNPITALEPSAEAHLAPFTPNHLGNHVPHTHSCPLSPH